MRSAIMLVLAGLLAGCADRLAAREAYLSRFVGWACRRAPMRPAA